MADDHIHFIVSVYYYLYYLISREDKEKQCCSLMNVDNYPLGGEIKKIINTMQYLLVTKLFRSITFL